MENQDRDFPLDHVPENARVGLLSLAAVLLGFTFFSPTMVAGGQVAANYSLNDFLKIMVIGNLILGLYVAIMAVIGTKTGLTSVLLSRYALGTAGAKWADILLGGTQLGWYAVSVGYVAELFVKALNTGESSYVFWAIFWSIVMGITAVYGFKGMEIVSYIAIPLILILAIWTPILGIQKAGSWQALSQIKPVSNMNITTALTVIVGTFASGGTQVTNWSRFAKNTFVSFFAAMLAFFIGNGLMIFAGGIGAIAFQQPDLVEVFLQMGIIFWALVILTINIWTTNDAAAYAFGVAGSEMFNNPNKKPFIIGGVLIATVLAATKIYNYFIPWLVFLGIFIPPLGGTIIGDYFFIWKTKLPKLDTVKFRGLRVANLIAYLIGVAAAWIGNSYNIGIPPLQGIIIAALMVPVVNVIFDILSIDDKHQLI